jgi:hypothetical protein
MYLSFPIRLVSAPTESAHKDSGSADSFSEFTLFLFGSGLALFVALLGWSDQIRGMTNDSRDLERQFLQATGLEKKQFKDVINAKGPNEALKALTVVMRTGKLKNANSVQLLTVFKDWNRDWNHLEQITNQKYNLTIALTISFFLSGIATLYMNPKAGLAIGNFICSDELMILLCPFVLMAILIGMIIYIAARERALRKLLILISDMV